jgi:MFS family permease
MTGRRDVAGNGPTLRQQVSSLPRDARLVLVGTGLFALGSGLTLPFLLVYLHDVRGFSTPTAGLVIGWIALAGLAVAPGWGVVVDRLGAKSALVAALLVEAAGVASLAVVSGLWTAFAVATCLAVGSSGVWPAQSSLMARVVPSGRRPWLFGVQFMLLNLGIGVGGLIAATIVDVSRPGTFQVLYLLDSVSYLAYVVVLTRLSPGAGRAEVEEDPPERPEEPRGEDDGAPGGYRVVLADRTFRRVFVVSFVLILFGYAQLEVGFTAYVTQVADLPARWLGIAFGANTATIVVGQLLVLRRLEGRSRSRALGLVGLLWATSWVGMAAAGYGPSLPVVVTGVALASAVFALGETLWSPVLPALVNDLAPDSLRGRYNAVSSVAWNIGSIVGPVYAGLLIGVADGSLWLVVTAGGCLLGGAMALQLRHHLTPAQDGRSGVGATMTQ